MVKLSSHIEVINGRLAAFNSIKYNQRVDFEVSKVEVDIYGIEADEEVDECVFFRSRDVGEESGSDGLARWERLSDQNVEDESFGINITDVDTTLVCEKDAVTLTLGVDANVIFGVGGVREEGLDNEVVQGASNGLNLGFFEFHQ